MSTVADRWLLAARVVAAGVALLFVSVAAALADNAPEPAQDQRHMVALRVCTANGQPLAGALGSIVAVEPSGEAAQNPESDAACHPHCGRHFLSGDDGLLMFDGLAGDMRYTIHLETEDCLPKAIVAEPKSHHVLLEIKLSPKPPTYDERSRISGLVQLPDGRPAFDAHVVVRSTNPPVQGGHYDSEAATDREGRFVLHGAGPWTNTMVSVEADGCVAHSLFSVKGGEQVNTLQLIEGATIRGRVLRDAKGVPAVTVTLVPLATHPSNRARFAVLEGDALPLVLSTTTDAEGRYVFEHVIPRCAHQLFVPMTGAARDNLFSHPLNVHSPSDGQATVAAELNLHPAHQISGKIVTEDGRALPEKTVVELERLRVKDRQTARVDSGGHFSFAAVPSEIVVLSFHTVGQQFMAGHRLSRKNRSADAVTANLRGYVDEDRQLTVLLEPGRGVPYIVGQPRPARQVLAVVGAAGGNGRQRMLIQQGGKRMIVDGDGQMFPPSRELEPLAGISDEELSLINVQPHFGRSAR